eukprot:NODE_10_length_61504_cov_0.956502.p43 type:complete len:150 gc:universal NODE_10_length_61504_cov_0.956502:38007-37558(-)
MRNRSRDKCPWTIVNDLGGAYSMGLIGGAILHAIKGYRHAPAHDKLRSSLTAVQFRAPILGGNFAAWAGLFSAFECGLTSYRQKEDFWTPVSAGALTGAVLASRSGLAAMSMNALFGGLILAGIEGLMFSANRLMSSSQQMQAEPAVAA